MNSTTTPQFNPIHYAKKMAAIGFTQQQAEGQAEALIQIIDNNLATKTDIFLIQRDIKEIESNLKRDIKEIESNLKRDIKELESNLKRDIKELELKISNKIENMTNKNLYWVLTFVSLSTAILGLIQSHH